MAQAYAPGHRYGTELDLGPDSAHGSLAADARRFRFIQRYPHHHRDFRSGGLALLPIEVRA